MRHRFFESTRGRIVQILRGGRYTVEEIASMLGLTDNAVRAHLLALERDGLVRASGARKGVGKPAQEYSLTPQAEELFPKPYAAVLDRLIAVLKGRLSGAELEACLREVGRAIASSQARPTGNLEARAEAAVQLLNRLGGLAELDREHGALVIRGRSCPLGGLVREHPELCKLAQEMVEAVIGAPVKECCDRSPSPVCRFEVGST